MKQMIGFALLGLLAVSPVMAQSITIDYAHDYDFDTIKTFQYVDTEESNIQDDPLMAGRVVDMIKKELREGGLQEVSENPDIYVTYHFMSEERKSYTTSGFGYGGYWDGWYGWGGPSMSSTTTREYSFTEGTLVIDAYDSQEKKMIWRGTGTVTVKAKPEKQIKQVDNILTKLGKRWDKILRGQGK